MNDMGLMRRTALCRWTTLLLLLAVATLQLPVAGIALHPLHDHATLSTVAAQNDNGCCADSTHGAGMCAMCTPSPITEADNGVTTPVNVAVPALLDPPPARLYYSPPYRPPIRL